MQVCIDITADSVDSAAKQLQEIMVKFPEFCLGDNTILSVSIQQE